MDEGSVLSKTAGSVLDIKLNRPSRLNVLDRSIIEGMIELVSGIENNGDIRVIVIGGAGGKAFCSGVDIRFLSSLGTDNDRADFSSLADKLFFMLESVGVPVIAAIDGYCLGGGLELAMSCDLRIATTDSVFGLPETKLGIIPGGGGTLRFPWLAGISKGKELLFTSDKIKADEALSLGLLNYVVEKQDLQNKVDEITAAICGNSFNAVKNAKKTINESFRLKGYELETRLFAESFKHPDRKEGMDAFLSKRKPKFQ